MKKLNHKRLAEGELTGHAHTALAEDVEIFAETETSDERELKTSTGTDVVHHEHETRHLPGGDFKVGKQKEFDPFEQEIRSVKD